MLQIKREPCFRISFFTSKLTFLKVDLAKAQPHGLLLYQESMNPWVNGLPLLSITCSILNRTLFWTVFYHFDILNQNQLWNGLPTRLVAIPRELISLAYLDDEAEASNNCSDYSVNSWPFMLSGGTVEGDNEQWRRMWDLNTCCEGTCLPSQHKFGVQMWTPTD